MKKFRFDFSGGMTFRGLPEGTQVRLLDNAQVLGNVVESHRVPLPVGPRTSTGTIQIFWYRGRFITSTAKRSYLPEYIGGNEQIIFTEYGTYTKKQINKYETYLGVIRPTLQATLAAGGEIVMMPPALNEVPSGGSIAKDTHREYRLALKTAYGIMPPSGKAIITTTASNAAVRLRWSVPSVQIPFTGIMVFGGNEGGGDHALLADLPPSQTSYTDDGTGSAQLDYAENYDQSAELQYVYTFYQDIDGITAESAPSPLTNFISGQIARLLKFQIYDDGYWDQNGIKQETLDRSDLEIDTAGTITDIVFEDNVALHGEVYNLNDIYFDQYTGFVKATFDTAAEGLLVAKGDMLIATGWTGSPVDGKAVRVWEVDEDGLFCHLDLLESDLGDGVPTTASLTRITHGLVNLAEYNGDFAMVVFSTDAAHGMKELDRIELNIDGDANFTNRVFEVIRIQGVENKFGIKNFPMPGSVSETGVITGTWRKPVHRLKILEAVRLSTAFEWPDTSDWLRLNYFLDSDLLTIKAAYPVCIKAPGALYLTLRTGIPIETGQKLNNLSIEWYPRNNGILSRVIYRTGDTQEFLKVDEIALDCDEYYDYKDTMGLGIPVPTYRITNGKAIVEIPPPETLECLETQYGITFAIDGYDVRWTPTNKPNGWPEAYRSRFSYRPIGIKAYNQALIVLCEDGNYRLDGSDPDYLTISKTLAEDACISRDSIQKSHRGLVYAGKRGIYLFDGQNSVCVTEHRMDAGQIAGSAYLSSDAFWWLPNVDTKAFAHALHVDLDGVMRHETEDGQTYDYPIVHKEWIDTWIDLAYNLNSFIWDGCYYLYSGHLDTNYNAMGMWMMDLKREGFPLYHTGLRPVHVFVSDIEEVWMLLASGPASTTVTVEELA